MHNMISAYSSDFCVIKELAKKLNHCKKYRIYGIMNVVAHVFKKDYPTHISAKVVSSVKGLFV